MFCSELQCVVVRCGVLQCVAVRCSVMRCVAVRCSVLQCDLCIEMTWELKGVACGSVLQSFAACCNMLQCIARGDEGITASGLWTVCYRPITFIRVFYILKKIIHANTTKQSMGVESSFTNST